MLFPIFLLSDSNLPVVRFFAFRDRYIQCGLYRTEKNKRNRQDICAGSGNEPGSQCLSDPIYWFVCSVHFIRRRIRAAFADTVSGYTEIWYDTYSGEGGLVRNHSVHFGNCNILSSDHMAQLYYVIGGYNLCSFSEQGNTDKCCEGYKEEMERCVTVMDCDKCPVISIVLPVYNGDRKSVV